MGGWVDGWMDGWMDGSSANRANFVVESRPNYISKLSLNILNNKKTQKFHLQFLSWLTELASIYPYLCHKLNSNLKLISFIILVQL